MYVRMFIYIIIRSHSYNSEVFEFLYSIYDWTGVELTPKISLTVY